MFLSLGLEKWLESIDDWKVLDTIHDKFDIISHKIKEVIDLFTPLVSRGIPFFSKEKGPLLSQKEYLDKLVNCRWDHSKFEDMQQDISGRVVFDKLVEEFELLFDFTVTCAKVPNFFVSRQRGSQSFGTWNGCCRFA